LKNPVVGDEFGEYVFAHCPNGAKSFSAVNQKVGVRHSTRLLEQA
jgi:hypothetical protein